MLARPVAAPWQRRCMREAALAWRLRPCAAHLATALWWRDTKPTFRQRMRCWALRWRCSRNDRHLSMAVSLRRLDHAHGTQT